MKKQDQIEIHDSEQLFSVLWGIVEKVCENIPGEREACPSPLLILNKENPK